MSKFNNDPNVKTVKHRIAALGISLEPFIEKITFVYHKPLPIGFRFVCKNPDALFRSLAENPHFGIDQQHTGNPVSKLAGHIASSQTRGLSIREINDFGSLHLSISKKLSLSTLDNCEIHLDTISISKGLDADGGIIYDLANLPQHIVTDLLEKPNLIVNGEGFFKVGLHF